MSPPTAWPDRATRWQQAREQRFDVLVIGGGITGAGLALDLRLRGLEVLLVERGDWAAATSSASSRLVHGGLRYLETFDFGLVRESCLERALLLRNAAGLVWPERFLFPLHADARVGRARLGAGLLLYSLLSLPRPLGFPHLVSAAEARRRVPNLREAGLRGGGSYLDAATHDARLTLAVAQSASAAGATCLSRTEATAIEGSSRGASVELLDRLTSARCSLQVSAVALAAGPFTDELRARAGLGGRWIAPTRGTHIVVERERLPTDGAVIFASPVDGRVMFLIPWPRHTVIGTTDVDASASSPIAPSPAELAYLLDSANGLVPAARLSSQDIRGAWAGLRPLLASDAANPSARTREERSEAEGRIFTIAGGKLTAYRAMAETLGARIARFLGRGSSQSRSPTRTHKLWGALAAPVERPHWSSLDAEGRPRAQSLDEALVSRYGSLAPAVRSFCAQSSEPTRLLSPDTLAAERRWAEIYEDATTDEDFALRRTTLALTRPAPL